MHQAICYISLCAVALVLSGCGQSGALQLPSDSNYDSRAKYLLYSDKVPKQVEEKSEQVPVQQADKVENSNSTTP